MDDKSKNREKCKLFGVSNTYSAVPPLEPNEGEQAEVGIELNLEEYARLQRKAALLGISEEELLIEAIEAHIAAYKHHESKQQHEQASVIYLDEYIKRRTNS